MPAMNGSEVGWHKLKHGQKARVFYTQIYFSVWDHAAGLLPKRPDLERLH